MAGPGPCAVAPLPVTALFLVFKLFHVKYCAVTEIGVVVYLLSMKFVLFYVTQFLSMSINLDFFPCSFLSVEENCSHVSSFMVSINLPFQIGEHMMTMFLPFSGIFRNPHI